jgi:transformation/transcription domain-associated protein
VAVRHILATELRTAFVGEFETLLNDELLFGVGYTAGNVMRPLVYSTIADLVHHIRLDLSAETILRVIDIYARCLHDPSLPYGIQTMSAKLLLNLMDCVNGDKMDPQMRRPVTMKILTILLCKYRRLARIVKEVNKRRFNQAEEFNRGFDVYWDDPDNARLINSDMISADSNRDIVRDIKFILKTITAGVKSIILSFKTNYISFATINPNEPQASADPSNTFAGSCNFTLAESKLFIDFFRDGVACFDICQVESSMSPSASAIPSTTNSTSISAEDKDLVDQFAYIFTLLDPYIFQDVLSAHLEYLFGKIVKNPLLLIIPQYFLAINTVSRNFSGILIKFLMDKFEMVGESSIHGSSLLRLFKLVFLAVSVYPDENEQMILPYISDIILNCLRLSSQSASPLNYFLLLKALFRGIAGGRFEHLYKEVLPILPLLLETLNRLATAAGDKQMRDLYVELCLTTPVRLSVLLPYLPLLMRPLVLALTSETELVSQGLRTLELCVDNLTQDFLEPILAPVLPSLLAALWSLLRGASDSSTNAHANANSYAQYSMKILGKFGGRGRRFMKYPLKLEIDASGSRDACLSLIFSGAGAVDDAADAGSLQLSLDSLIPLLSDYFSAPQSKVFEGYCGDDLFSLLMGCLSAITGFDVREESSIDPTLLSASAFTPDSTAASAASQFSFDEESVLKRLKTAASLNSPAAAAAAMMTELNAEKTAALFNHLCKALFQATLHADASIATQARMVLNHLCDRFVIIQLLAQRNSAKDYSFAGLTPNAFLEVVAEQISSSQEQLTNFSLVLLQRIHSQLITYIPVERIAEFPLFFLLVEKLIAFCYDAPFHAKLGACRGLKMVAGFGLGVRWMWVQESRILRGLLYILKDMPPFCTEGEREEVSGVLLMVLRLCHDPSQLDSLLHGLSTDAAINDARGKDQYYFNQIMSILISELTSPNSTIRKVVHASFTLLAECHACQVAELLSPHRDRLLLPIFTKPLRALPFTLQIGYVDAVNYCLSLKPPLVSFSEELLRLIHEALALVEADDTALASKTGQLKNATNLVNLRVVCISLLSTAIAAAEFQDPKLHQIRNHIVSAFFKSLYSKAPEIVAVARAGLEQVILHQQKLPKDLLQHGLRPVLINLAEAKRLTLAGLEGLSKVLQLLTSYFKAEIGKKLLDHVGVWADQKMLEDLAGKPLLESMEVRVIVAILDVFHLLPPSANLFLEELIVTVGKLDSWTKRSRSSPFRRPLFKFLYKHPQDALRYLLSGSYGQGQNFMEVFECAIECGGTLFLGEREGR